jgi:small subunit ribosomal protein S1
VSRWASSSLAKIRGWASARRYPQGTRLFGKVTNITDYGAFVEVEQGIEGLVHVSEMDWTNKNVHPSKVVQLGDEVEVMILEIDEDRRRISLGMKQCMSNPWDEFARTTRRATRFAARSSPSPTSASSSACRAGSTVWSTCPICRGTSRAKRRCAIQEGRGGRSRRAGHRQVERERISLGIKQLEGDPFNNYVATHDKNSIVEGSVKTIDPKGAVIALEGEVEGYLRASEVSRDRVEDIRSHLKEGDRLTAMIINIDRKNRTINLSIKAKDMADESDAMQKVAAESPGNAGTTSLGALLKAKLDNKNASQ